jgi:4'-phosphopantetheinyl transferase EntD
VVLIKSILPADVSCAEAFDDPADGALFPEEEQVIAKAVGKRRREFTTGRWCARRALAGLGVPAVPILPGERGAPTWPQGIAGSITHCAGYRAAAVAWTADVASIGLDAEPADALPSGILAAIALPAETVRVGQLAEAKPDVPWDRLLFSAKESVYKAWFPLARRWLGFEQADISFDAAGTFEARLLVPGPFAGDDQGTVFSGRWLAAEGLILTAIAVPAAR